MTIAIHNSYINVENNELQIVHIAVIRDDDPLSQKVFDTLKEAIEEIERRMHAEHEE